MHRSGLLYPRKLVVLLAVVVLALVAASTASTPAGAQADTGTLVLDIRVQGMAFTDIELVRNVYIGYVCSDGQRQFVHAYLGDFDLIDYELGEPGEDSYAHLERRVQVATGLCAGWVAIRGDDRAFSNGGGTVRVGAGGTETLYFTGRTDLDRSFSCFGIPATIVGTDRDDVLIGTHGPDVIYADAGDDIVRGAGGADIICGGAGADQLWGNAGKIDCSAGRATTFCAVAGLVTPWSAAPATMWPTAAFTTTPVSPNTNAAAPPPKTDAGGQAGADSRVRLSRRRVVLSPLVKPESRRPILWRSP